MHFPSEIRVQIEMIRCQGRLLHAPTTYVLAPPNIIFRDASRKPPDDPGLVCEYKNVVQQDKGLATVTA